MFIRTKFQVFKNFYHNFLFRLAIGHIVDIESHPHIWFRFRRVSSRHRLGRFSSSRLNRHIVVVMNDVCVLEVDDSVRIVRVKTVQTVGVLALIACKNNLVGLVALYLTERLLLLGISWGGFCRRVGLLKFFCWVLHLNKTERHWGTG